jgi:hypothetical protein
MANLRLQWQSSPASNVTTQTVEERSNSNPLVPYILTHSKRGVPKKVIMENLMHQGYSYRSIKTAYVLIDKMNKSRLDWRSPTAINETARMIRRDIRAGKVTYSAGMRILLSARDNLKTLIPSNRDKRITQLNQEIKTTKKLLMGRYANPLMVRQFRIQGVTV